MFKKLVALLILTAVVLVGWTYNRIESLPQQTLGLTQDTLISVEKGTTANQFAQILQAKGWIDDARWIKVLYRLKPELTAIKAGEYQLQAGMTLGELYTIVLSGESVQYRATLIEGSTVKELLATLKENDALVHTLNAEDAKSLASELDLDQDSAEGLFLAETYHFERGTTDRAMLLRAHQMLTDALDQYWAERPDSLPLKSAYEALILASIVEKETGLSSERPQISGVFIRRLNRGMRLQTDPTVIYGMGDKYQGNITRKDLQTPTDYNTYVIAGLPPTPIATVGREALQAALNPAEGRSLYFVARGDGSHQFSDTLKQHNQAVQEYQLKRRNNYRSAPGES